MNNDTDGLSTKLKKTHNSFLLTEKALEFLNYSGTIKVIKCPKCGKNM